MSITYWLLRLGMPRARKLAVMIESRSGRLGMNMTVNARPAILMSGCRTRKSPSYWLYVPAPPPRPPLGIVISSADVSLERLSHSSGTFGRPSGKRSPVHAFVYSTICSLVQVQSWAFEAGGWSKPSAQMAIVKQRDPRIVPCISPPKATPGHATRKTRRRTCGTTRLKQNCTRKGPLWRRQITVIHLHIFLVVGQNH